LTTRKGGHGVCSVCGHAERDAIDAAIVQGVSLAKIGKQYGLTESSLRRHKRNHPRRDMQRLEPDTSDIMDDQSERLGWLQAELAKQFQRTLAEVRAAEKSGSSAAIQGAHREHRQTLAAIAKWTETQTRLEIAARPGGAINVLSSPEWMRARWIVLDVLTFEGCRSGAEIRAEIARRFAKAELHPEAWPLDNPAVWPQGDA